MTVCECTVANNDYNGLTFAAIFVVLADSAAVGNVQGGVRVQERSHAISQGPVVQVVQFAVVVIAVGGSGVEE